MVKPRVCREYLVWAACVFGAAMVLRVAYLGDLKALPFFDHPVMDASYHDTWAREILSGKLSRGEPFFRAPLYPYFLALLYAISKGSYLVPRLAQMVLGSLTSFLVFILARRYFGRLAGVLAGLACAAYPTLVYFDGELLTESLFIFLSMSGLLLAETAREKDKPRLWLAAGLAFGLALITRPNVALFVPVAVAGALLFSRRRVLAGILMAAGVLIPLVPVTVHNYAVSREFIPLVWQGGLNFYLGNNAAATGWSATSPEIRKDWYGGYADMIAIPREELGREPTFSEVSDYWKAKGTAFIRQQPMEWLRLVARKIGIFWNRMELPNNQDFNFMRLYSWVLRNPLVTFGTAAPLALVGLFAFWRQAKRLYFLYGLLLTSFAGAAAFFVCDRYRLPFVPPMLVLAGGSLSVLVAAIRSRKHAAVAAWLVSAGLAAVIINANFTGVRPPDFAQSYGDLGKMYVSLGDYSRAEGYLNKALAANPMWGEAYEQLGLIKMSQGDNPAAAGLLLKAVKAWPDVAAPYRSLAMTYLAEDSLEQARSAAETALRISPFLEGVRNVLGSIQRRQGHLDQAAASFLKEIEINPSDWRAYANLGSLYEQTGDLGRALEAYQKSLALSPGNAEVTAALAALHAKRGDYEAARSLLDKLPPEASDITSKYNKAVILQQSGSTQQAQDLYEEILKTNALHEGALVNLGVIYAKSGRNQEARSLWQRALAVNPGNQTARRNIELLDNPD